MKVYNIGIIGFGFIGKVHAYGYENIKYYYPHAPFRAKIYAVATSKQETAKIAKELYNIEFTTANWKEIVENPEIEIIDISSPNIYHFEQLVYSVEKGKHIYCEKPVVSYINEAIELEKYLKNYNKIHQVTFHNRFLPATIKTKELISKGEIGEIISFRIAYYHSGAVEKTKPIGWKQEKGAGVLLDLGSHVIDLIYYFIGEFDQVCGSEKILYPERPAKDGKIVKCEVEDYVIVNVKMKNKAIGIIEASKIATGTEDELKYEIYGTQGSIRFNSTNPNFLYFYSMKEKNGFKEIPTLGKYDESDFPGPKFTAGWIRAHIHSIYNFLNSIYKNQPASPSLFDGIYNIKVCNAIKKSISSGHWETVET